MRSLENAYGSAMASTLATMIGASIAGVTRGTERGIAGIASDGAGTARSKATTSIAAT